MNLRLTSKPSTNCPDFVRGTVDDWDIAVRAFGGTETRFMKNGKRSDKHFGRCYKNNTPINGFLPNISDKYNPCVLLKCTRDVDEVFEILDQVDFIKDCDYMSTPSLNFWEVVQFYLRKKEEIERL